jgi:hypothetical protein
MTPLFIAEVKVASPFGFESEHSWDDLFDLACEHGDAVAVHTDTRWGGGFSDISAAKNRIASYRLNKLIVAKGIHAKDSEIALALACGANLVTVVGRVPPPHLAPVCIYEPRTFDEYVRSGADRQRRNMMWNERDLETGWHREEEEDFGVVRSFHPGWLCQASFIEHPDQVDPHADAFIVGEHLPTFVEEL